MTRYLALMILCGAAFAGADEETIEIHLPGKPAQTVPMPQTNWDWRSLFFCVGDRPEHDGLNPLQQAVVLGAQHYVVTSSVPPAVDFADPVAVRKLRDSDYTLTVRLFDEQGNPTEAFETPGFYGAEIEAVFESGECYTVRRSFYRLPEGTALEQSDETTAIRLAAVKKPGRQPEIAAEYRWDRIRAKNGHPLRYKTIDFLPADYDADPEKRWPTIIYLHGVGGTWTPYDQLAADPFFETFRNRDRFLIVAPHSPELDWKVPSIEALVNELITNRRADPERIYLTGFSMGGNGTWKCILALPDRFAAAAVLAGEAPLPDPEPVIGSLPLWVLCGGQDYPDYISSNTPVMESRQKKGYDAVFRVVPEYRHMDVRNNGYADPALYDWFLKHRRAGSHK